VCSLFLSFSLQPSEGFSLRYGCGCSVLEVIETYEGEAKKERRMMMRRRESVGMPRRDCVSLCPVKWLGARFPLVKLTKGGWKSLIRNV
jgi:hypothetical protein